MKLKFTSFVLSFIALIILSSMIKAEPAGWVINQLNNPAPGYIRFEMGYMVQIDNYGNRKFIDSSSFGSNSSYALLKNGNTLEAASNKMYIRNINFIRIDSIPYTPGFNIDFHDVILLDNGHYLILYSEYYTQDLSQIVPEGHVNANIMANVLIETDRTGTVYWIWHSRDHYNIQDVTDDIDLSQEFIDFTHINSMCEDTDGNIIVSIRHLDEISKINKANGNFIWRMGGSASKNNQFQFISDTRDGFTGFSHQHSVHILPNGNLIIFDNGNMKPNQYTRVIEYSLNQTEKKVTKFWEYLNPSGNYVGAMGSVARLPNGNTLVNWSDRIIEVRPDFTKTFEMFFNDFSLTYKAYRVTDRMADATRTISSTGYFDFNDEGSNNTGVKIQITGMSGSTKTSVEKHNYAPSNGDFADTTFTSILPYRYNISNTGLLNIQGKIFINLSGLSGIKNSSKLAIYYRPNETKGQFTELSTSFNQLNNEISANITSFGEFCIGSKVLNQQIVIYPKNNQYSIPTDITFSWYKQQSAKSYQVQISKNINFTELIHNQILSKNDLQFNNLLENSDYYWRVRAFNQIDTSSWSQTNLFHTVISKPDLIFPLNNEIVFNKEDSMKWVCSDFITTNWIQIAKDDTFLDLVVNYSKAGKWFDASKYLQNNTQYFWRVCSYRNTDTSNWSQIRTFRTAFEKPKLQSPVNDSINVNTSAQVRWAFVQGATYYHVQIANDSLFNDVVTESDKIMNTFFVYNNLNFDRLYFWRVKVNNKPEDENWSNPHKFYTMLEKPTLNYPSFGENVFAMNIKFNWKVTQNTKTYTIVLSLKPDCSSPILTVNNLSNPNVVISELPAYSVIYWRIKSFNGIKESDWSNTGMINTDNIIPISIPKLVSPEDNSENNIFGNFEWIKSNRAISYFIQLSKNSDFKNLIINKNLGNISSYDFNNLDPESTYYWRMKAFSQFDSSSWSSTFSFNTPKFIKIILLSPSNEELQVSKDLAFNWINIPNVSEYIIQYSEDTNFVYSVSEISKLNKNIANISNLKTFTRYFWRVKYKIGNEESNWSNVWNFRTVSDLILDKPNYIKPSNKESGIPVSGIFTWNKVNNADNYNLLICKKNSFIEPQIHGNNLMTNEFEYSGLDNNSVYFTKVSAKNYNSGSYWSDISEFLTALKNPENLYPQNNSTNIPLNTLFSWDDVNSAESYEFQLSFDSTFATYNIDEEVLVPFYSSKLTSNLVYYWRVKAKNQNNFSNWSSIQSFATGVYNSIENDIENLVSIYPNPASELVMVNNVFSTNFKIYNIQGELVKQGNILNSRIYLSDLNQGVYMLQINGINYKLIKI